MEPRLGLGIRVGGLAAASTAGVLVGYGLPLTVPGLLVHVGWSLLAGVAFTLADIRLRGRHRIPLAVAVAAMFVAVVRHLTPWTAGLGASAPLAVAHSIVLATVLAITLVVGMRLALSGE